MDGSEGDGERSGEDAAPYAGREKAERCGQRSLLAEDGGTRKAPHQSRLRRDSFPPMGEACGELSGARRTTAMPGRCRAAGNGKFYLSAVAE